MCFLMFFINNLINSFVTATILVHSWLCGLCYKQLMKLFLSHRQKDQDLSMTIGRNKMSGTLAKSAIHVENQILSQKHMKSVHLLTLMQLAFMQVLKESDGFFGFKYTLLRGSKSTRKMEIEKKIHNQKISIESQSLVEENNLLLLGVVKH